LTVLILWQVLDGGHIWMKKTHINIFEVAVENCVKNAGFNAKD
jgi:hypothetical protein